MSRRLRPARSRSTENGIPPLWLTESSPIVAVSWQPCAGTSRSHFLQMSAVVKCSSPRMAPSPARPSRCPTT
jgi:hypothetical protein